VKCPFFSFSVSSTSDVVDAEPARSDSHADVPRLGRLDGLPRRENGRVLLVFGVVGGALAVVDPLAPLVQLREEAEDEGGDEGATDLPADGGVLEDDPTTKKKGQKRLRRGGKVTYSLRPGM
jgi:hypothetical protein